MPEAEARIATEEASRYLTEVAQAWVHTYPVRYDTLTGEVELPGAELVMTADSESLTLRLISSDEDKFAAAKLSVARHVDRVAGRDTGVPCVWRELA
ncbi:MAG: DUF2218 domain-containing protein [Sphingomonas sp.]|uniref:DUF2218 domain-containing protein n=1 Tax=Sphingomonas sp. TaxID=28214 RepID=UPI00356A427B